MLKKMDELTPDERDAMARRIADVIDDFTTDAPEGETEPTARDNKEEADKSEDTKEETTKSEDKKEEKEENDMKKTDTLTRTNLVIVEKTDAVATQGKTTTDKKEWRTTADARRKFAELAYKNQGFKGQFDALWSAELAKHGSTKNDGITGLGLPVDGRQITISTLEESKGIISHFDFIGGKTYLVKLLTPTNGANDETARAGGHTKGQTKTFQALTSDPRQFYTVPVYKKLDIDYLELYENPELIQIRARELVQARIVEIERAMLIGDGRSQATPDRRMFRSTTGRGIYSMVADAADTGNFGELLATAVTAPAGSNLYDASIRAEAVINAEGRRVMVAKKSRITDFRLARLTANGDYVLAPGQSLEAALGVDAIYTPAWMDQASCDFITFVSGAPKLIGQAPASPDMKSFFDTTTDTDVLMAEGPVGGGLAAYKAAAVVTIASTSA